MSEFHVEVVRIGDVSKLPNADALEITQVHGGYPVIFRAGQFKTGDLAVHVPIDAIVDGNKEPFAFLKTKQRIRAKRLRGTFSMGLLVEAPEGTKEGDDVRAVLGVEKYEPPAERLSTSGLCAKAPGGPTIPVYDLEGLRRYMSVLVPDEEVVLTEKIHGANARVLRAEDGAIHVGSRTTWKREEADELWWPAVRAAGIDKALELVPHDHVIYGEVFGQVQDLTYGHARDTVASFRAFDVYNRRTGRFLDYQEAEDLLRGAGISSVPVLYRGPWKPELLELAEGKSTFANHVREGFVVRPVRERYAHHGRCVFKMVGEGYHLRKETP